MAKIHLIEDERRVEFDVSTLEEALAQLPIAWSLLPSEQAKADERRAELMAQAKALGLA